MRRISGPGGRSRGEDAHRLQRVRATAPLPEGRRPGYHSSSPQSWRRGRVAQLVRALVSHTRGPGFESLRDHGNAEGPAVRGRRALRVPGPGVPRFRRSGESAPPDPWRGTSCRTPCTSPASVPCIRASSGSRTPHWHIQPMIFAGTPTTSAYAGTSCATTAPAPTKAYSPSVVPQTTVAFAPIEAPRARASADTRASATRGCAD